MENQKPKVLLIEDDDFFRQSVVAYVEALGLDWEVDEATTVAEAKEKLQASKYDVCISDCQLPDGVVCEIFLKAEDQTPVFILSGHVDAKMIERAKKHSFIKGVFRKPISFGKLIQAVQSVLKDSQELRTKPLSRAL